MILVTEATGAIGTAAIEWLSRRNLTVRAAVGAPGNFRRKKNVEPIRFDWREPDSWSEALSGGPSLVLIGPPDLSAFASRVCEFVALASRSGCTRVSFVSDADAEFHRWLPHRRIERHLRQSGMSWTFLRSGDISQSLLDGRRPGVAGMELSVPDGGKKVAWVDARDLGEAAARVLLDEIWDQRAPVLTGTVALEFDEVCQILSAQSGSEVRCVPDSSLRHAFRLRFERGLSWGQCLEGIRIHRRRKSDRAAQVSDDLRLLLGRAPRGIGEFFRDSGAGFRLGRESPEPSTAAIARNPRKAGKASASRDPVICEV